MHRLLYSISALSIVAAFAAVASANPVFLIDIDTEDNTNGVGAITTQTGWTSLDATASNGANVTVDGVTFTVTSADGTRNRATGNALTRDFLFDDGSNQAAGLTVSGLPDGLWKASVWVWDEDATGLGNHIILMNGSSATGQYGGGEFIATSSFAPDPNEPFTFFFDTDDFNSSFGIFARENNSQNSARFNALQLELVPEPGTIAIWSLLGVVGLTFAWRQQKRKS